MGKKRLVQRREELATSIYWRAVLQVEQDCDKLLAQNLSGENSIRLQNRYIKHRDCLFVFLYQAKVPADNNAAERALRNSVIHRKVTGGFRSDEDANAHATTVTVTDTARKKGEDPFQTILQHLGQPIL